MKKEETTTTLRIPDDLYLAIQQRASKAGRSRNWQMLYFLRVGLVHEDGDREAIEKSQEIVREANL